MKLKEILPYLLDFLPVFWGPFRHLKCWPPTFEDNQDRIRSCDLRTITTRAACYYVTIMFVVGRSLEVLRRVTARQTGDIVLLPYQRLPVAAQRCLQRPLVVALICPHELC